VSKRVRSPRRTDVGCGDGVAGVVSHDEFIRPPRPFPVLNIQKFNHVNGTLIL